MSRYLQAAGVGGSALPVSVREEAERLLHNLQGVVAASIEETTSGLEHVHVLALTHRTQNQLLRDVRSALMAQLGIDVEPSKINVLMMSESFQGLRPTRPELVSVEVRRSETALAAEVSLAHHGTTLKGKAGGSALANPLELVAAATVRAVHQALEQRIVFFVDQVRVMGMGDSEVVLAALQLKTERLARRLLGASYVVESPFEACARAVLDAVNRQFDFSKLRP